MSQSGGSGSSRGTTSIVPSLIENGSITADTWLPVLGGDSYKNIARGSEIIDRAGIASEMFASKGAYTVVAASDFARARELVLADRESRPYVATDEQVLAWVKRHPINAGR